MPFDFDPTEDERAIYGRNNSCTKEGATRLKERIEQFWLERGHAVQVDVIEAKFHPSIRATRFDVRSNMIGGFPRKVLGRQ